MKFRAFALRQSKCETNANWKHVALNRENCFNYIYCVMLVDNAYPFNFQE